MEYVIEVYENAAGKIPFNNWLDDLDVQLRQKIRMKIQRLGLGNFGHCEPVGQNLFELKIDLGPGFRVYFSKIAEKTLLVLWAGTKRHQQRDIEKAKEYLKDFKQGQRHGKK